MKSLLLVPLKVLRGEATDEILTLTSFCFIAFFFVCYGIQAMIYRVRVWEAFKDAHCQAHHESDCHLIVKY